MTSFKPYLLILLMTLLSACAGSFNPNNKTTDPVELNDSASPITSDEAPATTYSWPVFDWDGKHADSTLWNEFSYNAVEEKGRDLTSTQPEDIQAFCPNYYNLNSDDKIFFWISLVAAMSRYESGFKPETFYQENFKDQNGEYIISRGLLQLSIESAKGYKCPINVSADLHDAKINLDCSFTILNQWVARDGLISGYENGQWLGGARYWSVLRKESTKAKILATTAQSTFCQ